MHASKHAIEHCFYLRISSIFHTVAIELHQLLVACSNA